MSKTLTIRTTCVADVTETWTYSVPDDFALPADQDEQHDLMLEILDSGGGGEWDGKPVGATFVSVEDEADNEHDRDVKSFELTNDDPVACIAQTRSLDEAKQQVCALILDQYTASDPDAKPVTVHLETWNTETSDLGVRVAEVNYTVIDPAPAIAAGASIMQCDTDGGLQICAAVERLLVSIMRGFPDNEIEEDKDTLLYLLGKE